MVIIILKIHIGDCYAYTIPMDKLLKLACEDIQKCGANCDDNIRKCAEKIVLENICTCVSTAEPIIDALVDEYVRQVRNERCEHGKE